MSNVLYTKYRPRTFEEVIGQDVSVKILKRSIETNKINHAYLFYGIRGTGKTTLARIFAKTINCRNQVDQNPCNNCESCKQIDSNSMYDVIELDAASNNGVDEIRELTHNANYASTNSKYKIYIIDEVHMLTKSAFNALLKTLEEPPKNTIFLLATTEINKIPDTILSRTIIMNLKMVSKDLIISHLESILEKENRNYDKESLIYISELSEGSVRDSISYLETVILFDEELKKDETIKALGVLDKNTILKLIKGEASVNLIDETINGKRLSILVHNLLIELILSGDNSFKKLLNLLVEGMISINDPYFLNKYIKSILITSNDDYNHKENVSRETNLDKEENIEIESLNENYIEEKNIEEKNVEEENVEEEDIKEIIDEETIEQDVSRETLEESIKENDNKSYEDDPNISLEEKDIKKSEELVNPNKIDEKPLSIVTDIFSGKDYAYVILNGEKTILDVVKSKWIMLNDYSKQAKYKKFIRILSSTSPLISTDNVLIIGFKEKWLIEEFKRISLTKSFMEFIEKILGWKSIVLPIDEEKWNKLVLMAKEAVKNNVKIKSDVDPSRIIEDIFDVVEENTIEKIFGDKLE